MIERESLPVKVIEQRDAHETCTCNICKKIIYKRSCANSPELPKNLEQTSYWEVTTGHNDWGNDSGDSIEHFDICSPECLNKIMTKYIKRSNSNFNTEYIEIEHTRTSCYQKGE